MTIDGASDRARSFRRRRRLVTGVGVLGVGACFTMAFATQGPAGPAERDRRADEFDARFVAARDPSPTPVGSDASPRAPSDARPAAVARTRRVRVRVIADGVAIPGAIVRVVTFDRVGQTATARSDAARTGSDGVADLSVDETDGDAASPDEPWIEVASVTTHGFRHGYTTLRKARSRDGELEISIPRAGRLEIRLEGLPAEKIPAYVDVRFLTPDGGWQDLFADLPATPVEDGGLFEMRAIPRVQRVRLRSDGTGEVPEVPSDHGIYLEFTDNPDGWLVEKSEFSGCSAEAMSGEVCRVAEGTTGVYRVRYRRAPSARVRVEDELGAPIANADVAVGIRHAGKLGASRVFDTTSTTAATGQIDLPLWTGTRIPDWSPVGLVIVAYAPGRSGRVIETDGGWYGQSATVRLDRAPGGVFVLEGTLRHANGTRAAGVPVRISAAAPWNGDSALPPVGATTDGEGAWRIEVPEAYRPVYAYGRRLRLDVDGERLESTSSHAMWRRQHPDLPRATTLPEAFDLPPPGSTTVHDASIVLPIR